MKIKKDVKGFSTDDFLFDLFEGYIKPEEYTEESEKVRAAMQLIEEFGLALQREGVMEII